MPTTAHARDGSGRSSGALTTIAGRRTAQRTRRQTDVLPTTRSSGLSRHVEKSELRVYGPQELHKLVNDHAMGFVLYPVAHIVEFEPSHKTRKAGTHLVYGKRIEFFHSLRLPPNEERRL